MGLSPLYEPSLGTWGIIGCPDRRDHLAFCPISTLMRVPCYRVGSSRIMRGRLEKHTLVYRFALVSACTNGYGGDGNR